PVEFPAGPARSSAHACRPVRWSATPQSAVPTVHLRRSSLSCPSGVVPPFGGFERPTVGGYATSLLQRAGAFQPLGGLGMIAERFEYSSVDPQRLEQDV